MSSLKTRSQARAVSSTGGDMCTGCVGTVNAKPQLELVCLSD